MRLCSRRTQQVFRLHSTLSVTRRWSRRWTPTRGRWLPTRARTIAIGSSTARSSGRTRFGGRNGWVWPLPFNLPSITTGRTLGEERAWKADPVRALMRPGLLVAGGSDSTVTPLGPLIGVHAAVNHSNPAERVSLQEALALYTINAARIAFQEADRGSLEAGKLGDLVVLAEDPFEVDPSRLKDIPVEMTVIGGHIAYQAE
jgi:hypothetical protein